MSDSVIGYITIGEISCSSDANDLTALSILSVRIKDYSPLEAAANELLITSAFLGEVVM